MLTLKIENFDRLPDGGPLSFRVDGRGFDFGRDQHLDWSLPDPSRFISGKHCEVRFFDGAYWLYDVSTNGTFVNKSVKRVQSPYKLGNGDQLNIGEYIISVAIDEVARPQPPQPPPGMTSQSRPADDIWKPAGEVPPPINPRDLQPPARSGSRAADFLHDVVAAPPPVQRSYPPLAPPPFQPGGSHDPWTATGLGTPPPMPPGDWGAVAELPQPAVPESRPRPAPGPDRSQIEREFIRQFAQGANINEDVLLSREPGELARELGLLFNLVCGNLMQLLSARAAAKTLARSGHRTMIQSAENNPLKFMPTPEEAIRVMLGVRSDGYLDGRRTIEKSFADLKTHQVASLAAMQHAVAQLFEELAPEAIEKAAGGQRKALLGSNKAKFWDAFCERWKAKTAHHENGMIEVFLELFAEFYDRETRNRH